ncbi:MAG: VirB8/TrbF family protein [Bacteroidetes bacterium]|nr:VirB8/TrbF family protein [Bacteroidota bacterium]
MAKQKQTSAHAWVEGRAEMDRMFGDLALRRRQWMLAGLVSMACSIILALGNVTLILSDRNTPWVVEVDKLGDIRVAGAVGTTTVPDHAKVSVLHRAIHGTREVSSDAQLLNAQLLNAQLLNTQHRSAVAHLAGGAREKFIEALQLNAEDLQKMITSDQRRYVKGIRSLLQLPGQAETYRVTWAEEYVGGRTTTVAMEGYFQIEAGEIPSDESGILNPLGLYITQYSYSTITEDNE